MVKKLSRQQKAANTRKANKIKASKEIATKIGIIRNKHKIVAGLKEAIKHMADDPWKVSENQVGPAAQETYKLVMPKDYIVTDGPAVISLSKALDNSLDKLEQRMADYIARVDRILA